MEARKKNENKNDYALVNVMHTTRASTDKNVSTFGHQMNL